MIEFQQSARFQAQDAAKGGRIDRMAPTAQPLQLVLVAAGREAGQRRNPAVEAPHRVRKVGLFQRRELHAAPEREARGLQVSGLVERQDHGGIEWRGEKSRGGVAEVMVKHHDFRGGKILLQPARDPGFTALFCSRPAAQRARQGHIIDLAGPQAGGLQAVADGAHGQSPRPAQPRQFFFFQRGHQLRSHQQRRGGIVAPGGDAQNVRCSISHAAQISGTWRVTSDQRKRFALT